MTWLRTYWRLVEGKLYWHMDRGFLLLACVQIMASAHIARFWIPPKTGKLSNVSCCNLLTWTVWCTRILAFKMQNKTWWCIKVTGQSSGLEHCDVIVIGYDSNCPEKVIDPCTNFLNALLSMILWSTADKDFFYIIQTNPGHSTLVLLLFYFATIWGDGGWRREYKCLRIYSIRWSPGIGVVTNTLYVC